MVWVADRNNSWVQGFSEGGSYLFQFGSKGSGSGQFSFETPIGIATDSLGDLWITRA